MAETPNTYRPKIYVGEKTWKMFKKVFEDISKEDKKKKDKK